MKRKSKPEPRAKKPARVAGEPRSCTPAHRSFPVIAMAASVGGLKALSVILGGLPADFPAAIAIVMHLAPDHKSILAEILDSRSLLEVRQAKTGDFLCRSCVFVAPPNHHLLVGKSGCLKLSSPDAEKIHHARPSAEPLFVSVAKVYQRNAIAVVLTGGDGDGSFGVQVIKDEGGMVIAQDRPTSQDFSMPETSIKTGDVDFVLPLDEIAPMLMELVARGASQFLAGQGGVNPLPTRRRTRSPSPRPSPSKGEGGASTPVRESARSGSSGRGLRGSLSQRERAGVREKSSERPTGLQATKPERCGRGLGGTGHRPVAAGDPPAAGGAPSPHHSVRTPAVPQLGGKLPPRTAKLAVPPEATCIAPAKMRLVAAGARQKDGRKATKRRILTHALTKLATPQGSVGTPAAASKRRP